MTKPEQEARARIDKLLRAVGWEVQAADAANFTAHRGVAIREFPLETTHAHAQNIVEIMCEDKSAAQSTSSHAMHPNDKTALPNLRSVGAWWKKKRAMNQ